MRSGAVVLVLGLLAASCAGTAQDEGVSVVATTSILGDVVSNVVGDAASVEVLLPIGADPHDFQPSARQVAAVESADLIVANGLGLEAAFLDVLASLESEGNTVLRLGERLGPLRLIEGGGPDPHIWLDPLRMATAAELIAAELEAVAPGGPWRANAASYAAELQALDVEIAGVLNDIGDPGADPSSFGDSPLPGRVLVSNHDSLGYFAERYRFEVVGVVIPGGSTLAQPSSADLADLVRVIERRSVPAIFTEANEPSTLAESVASEVNGDIAVVELFVGSLGGPGSGAESLIDMLRTNARRIAEALG